MSSEMRLRVQAIIASEAQAVANIPLENPFQQVTDLIHDRCHKAGGKLVFTGVGKAGEIGRKMATTFSSTGTVSVFLHPLEAVHGDLGIIQPMDIIFAISNSGATREIVELIPLIHRLHPEMPVVGLTGRKDSPLAEASLYTLWTGNPAEVCPLGLAPTTSTTVMAVIGDVLICLQMDKTGFGLTQYAARHHGGYLGAAARDRSTT